MARGRRSSSAEHDEFWPGYVDVLSTLLLVVTFLLSIFMVSQFYVAQESSGKDSALRRLTRQIAELTNLMSLEKGKAKSAEDEFANLQASLASLREDNARLAAIAAGTDEKIKGGAAQIASLTSELDEKNKISAEAQSKVDLLNQQLLALRRQLAALNEALETSEKKDRDSQDRIKDMGVRLNAALARRCRSCSAIALISLVGCATC